MKATRSLLVLTALLTLGACAKKPQPVAAPAGNGGTAYDDSATRREAEERARREAEEARRREEMARAQAVLASMIYFDYDTYDIRSDSRQLLDTKIPLLRTHPGVTLRIVGHTDDRGSVEYNLALGMRRALATKEYLVGFGLDAERFDAISYGEEQPAADGAGETAWAQNRRAEFQVTGGAIGGR